MNHRAVVFAGGALTADAVARLHEPERADVWCVDSGLHHAITFGLRPHTIVGDCDSVSAEALESALVQGAKLQRHPPDKAASDLELTLHAVADAGYREVDLLAVSGGRTDHALLNWMLVLQCDWPFDLRIFDATITAQLVHRGASFRQQLPAGKTLSLVASQTVTGVTTAGLLYPLDNADLVGGTTLGLSNQVSVIENQPHAMISVRVSVATGRLLVCVVNDDI